MTTPNPDPPELRISDADREHAVQRLNDAVAEGRLTMAEFEERVAAVLAARTASQVAPHLADLPGEQRAPLSPNAGAPKAPAAREHAELRATMSNLKRSGAWVVPRRLTVYSRAGSVSLDLSEAVISHPVIEINLEVYAGSTTLILPEGASVDVEHVETGMVASSVVVKKVPSTNEPIGTPHVIVTGKQYAGSLRIRPRRRWFGNRR